MIVENPRQALDARFKLYDARGRMVQRSEERLHKGEKRIPLKRNLERGTYYATIRTDQDIHTQKIVLHR